MWLKQRSCRAERLPLLGCVRCFNSGGPFCELKPGNQPIGGGTPMSERDGESGRAMGRALIVDDDPTVRVRIGVILQSCGFDCVEATDGIDAMRFASEGGIDLIVTDIAMPRMDGLDFLAIISKGAFGANPPPAIVCSAHLDEDRYRHRPELDLAAVKLSKPFTTDDLIKAVAAAFPEI